MAKRPPRPDRLEQFKATYFAECQERQADIDRVLQAIREQGGDRERFDELFRAVHSIKGGGGAFGFEDIVSLAHSFETVLDALRQGTLELDEGVSEALVVAADALAASIENTQEAKPADSRSDEAKALLDTLIEADAKVASGETPPPPPEPEPEPERQPRPAGRRAWRIAFAPHGELFRSANDPLLIVRELQSLGDLEVGPPAGELPGLADMDPENSYWRWDFKLQTVQGLEQIREAFEFVEEVCDLDIAEDKPAAEPSQPATPLAAASTTMPAQPTQPALPAVSRGSIRVDLERVDKLVNMVGELVINQAVIEQHLALADIEDEVATRGLETLTSHMRGSAPLASDIGSENAAFVIEYLRREGMAVAAEHLGGDRPRRVHYYPASGKARMQLLDRIASRSLVRDEDDYLRRQRRRPDAPGAPGASDDDTDPELF